MLQDHKTIYRYIFNSLKSPWCCPLYNYKAIGQFLTYLRSDKDSNEQAGMLDLTEY